MACGKDPYEWKGYEDVGTPHSRRCEKITKEEEKKKLAAAAK